MTTQSSGSGPSGIGDRGNVFAELNGKPIRWTDKTGVTHICEGAEVHPNIRLIWTLCQRDVPANKAWLLDTPSAHELCAACAAAAAERRS